MDKKEIKEWDKKYPRVNKKIEQLLGDKTLDIHFVFPKKTKK